MFFLCIVIDILCKSILMKKIDGWNVIFKAEISQKTLHVRTREGFCWTHANKAVDLKMLISSYIKETFLFF